MKTFLSIIGGILFLPVVIPVAIVTTFLKVAYNAAVKTWNNVEF